MPASIVHSASTVAKASFLPRALAACTGQAGVFQLTIYDLRLCVEILRCARNDFFVLRDAYNVVVPDFGEPSRAATAKQAQ